MRRLFRGVSERARLLLVVTVGLPLALALVGSAFRLGGERRAAAAGEALQAAERLLAGTDARGLLESARAAGYHAALYRRTGPARFAREAALPPAFGDQVLPRRARERLEAGQGVAVRPLGGRTSVVAPVRAADGGVAGGLLLVADRAMPPQLPPVTMAAGLAVLLATLASAASFARRPRLAAAILVFLAPTLFAGALATIDLPDPGGFRLWVGVAFGAWALLAALGLVRVARAG